MSEKETRKPGYYWVKVSESPWIAAEWTDCHKDTQHGTYAWMVTGFRVAMGDGNLSAISETRILMPDEID